MAKNINTRMQQKVDTTANWKTAGDNGFTPLQGEIIVYQDGQQSKTKIGDGKTNINALPFQKIETFINVAELPTENISEGIAYRVLEGTFVGQKRFRYDATCYTVDWENGPTGTGESAIKHNGKNFTYVGYYNIKDNEAYAYINQETKDIMINLIDKSDLNEIVKMAAKAVVNGLSVGWRTFEDFIGLASNAVSVSWGGIIYTLEEIVKEDALYVFVGAKTYYRNNGVWISGDYTIGRRGTGSDAEVFNGLNNVASAPYAHAEGYGTEVRGTASHSEGYQTKAYASYSHVEGLRTTAGELKFEPYTITKCENFHYDAPWGQGSGYLDIYLNSVENIVNTSTYINIVIGDTVYGAIWLRGVDSANNKISVEGDCIGLSELSKLNYSNIIAALTFPEHPEAGLPAYSGNAAHAEGGETQALGQYSHAEGYNSVASYYYAHAEGANTISSGEASHAEGLGAKASGAYSHAEGQGSKAEASRSHAEGHNTVAIGDAAHAEGISCVAGKAELSYLGCEWVFDRDPNDAFAQVLGYNIKLGTINGITLEDIMVFGGITPTGEKFEYEFGVKALIQDSTAVQIGSEAAVLWKDFEDNTTDKYIKVKNKPYIGDKISGDASHAGGKGTIAAGIAQTAIGSYNEESTSALFIVGNGTDDTDRKNAFVVNSDGSATLAKTGEDDNSVATVGYVKSNIDTSLTSSGKAADAKAVGDELKKVVGKKIYAENGDLKGEIFNDYVNNKATGGYTHAEGYKTEATNWGGHAEGGVTKSHANYAHAEGLETMASGEASHAEGNKTLATGVYSHAEGLRTQAGYVGYLIKDMKEESYLWGEHKTGWRLRVYLSSVSGLSAGDSLNLVLGTETFTDTLGEINSADNSFILVSGREQETMDKIDFYQDKFTHAKSLCYAYVEGKSCTSVVGGVSHAEGEDTYAVGYASHAEGIRTIASGYVAHAEGYETRALGNYSHTGGLGTISTGDFQTVVGKYNIPYHGALFVVGNGSAETEFDENGNIVQLNRSNAFVVNDDGTASVSAVGEDPNNIVNIEYLENKLANLSPEDGTIGGVGQAVDNSGEIFNDYVNNEASSYAHAEGRGTKALGADSHAEGLRSETNTTGQYAHAEGYETKAYGQASHTEGISTKATGGASHAGGIWTIADGYCQTVVGRYNKEKTNSLFVVGDGAGVEAAKRADAFAVNKDGTITTGKEDYVLTKSVDTSDKSIEFCSLFADATGDASAFLFFTDAHFFHPDNNKYNMDSAIKYLQRYYEETPTSFVLNGGDMLQSGDTKEEACCKLGYADGKMNSAFDKYYYVFGNHDNNYQGANYAGNNVVSSDDLLTQNCVRNLCMRDQEKAYYTFKDGLTRYYVFDTGIDWDAATMSEFRWEQVDWFAAKLLANNDEHNVIIAHQLYYTGTTLNVLADNLTKIAQAYNNKTSITLNGKTYDFGAATGVVHYYLAGHSHTDTNTTVNGITCITTTNAYASSWTEPTFDLVLADYAANKLHLVRVGSGENREIDIL